MITTEQRQNIKSIPITAYLAGKEIFPVLQTGSEYCYFSPFRDERTPSFFVNTAKNVFNDFAGDSGDSIKLVMLLDNCDFIQAVKILQSVNESVDIELQSNLPASPQYQAFLKKITPLQHKALLHYICVERGIPASIAKSYVSEVHYRTSKGDFFSLGFRNESGGFELRNPKFKGCIGTKDVSIYGDPMSVNCFIFEGFINFLSFLSDRSIVPNSNNRYIILNSVSLVSKLGPLILHDVVHLFLDNDEAGKKAALKIMDANINAYNASHILHPEFKDYNDYYRAKQNRL